MTRPRTMSDGSIIFPNRGSPPTHVPGFIKDPKDPFHFFLDFEEDCKFRQYIQFTMPCGKVGIEFKCTKFNRSVNTLFCNSCFEGEKDVVELSKVP